MPKRLQLTDHEVELIEKSRREEALKALGFNEGIDVSSIVLEGVIAGDLTPQEAYAKIIEMKRTIKP